jgi:hypothetical protein
MLRPNDSSQAQRRSRCRLQPMLGAPDLGSKAPPPTSRLLTSGKVRTIRRHSMNIRTTAGKRTDQTPVGHLLPRRGRFAGAGNITCGTRSLSRLSLHSIEVAAGGAAPQSLSIGDPVERVGLRRRFATAAKAAAAKIRQRLLAVARPHLAP